jgi:hypothetical protein
VQSQRNRNAIATQIAAQSLRGPFATAAQSLCNRSEITLQPQRNRFAMFCDHLATAAYSCRNRFTIAAQSLRSAIAAQSQRNRSAIASKRNRSVIALKLPRNRSAISQRYHGAIAEQL